MSAQNRNMDRRSPRWAATALAVTAVLLVAASASAFKPTAEYGHVGIVRDGITPITRTATSGETLRFSDRAISQIRDATAGVDELFSSRGEFWVPTAHCDDELLPACSQRLITIKAAILSNLRSSGRDGEEARAQLGRALHTLQDFYSHSNWVNNPGPSHGSFNPALGVSTVPRLGATVPTCVDDFFDRTLTGAGLTNITSGYFAIGDPEPPPGKCAHGVISGAGIHKDAPGRPFFDQARARAVEGTRDFVNQILDDLAGNDDAIREFMDVRGTLGFVIDDTGSMGPEIAGVRSSVNQIVSRVAGTDDEPDNYLLQRFGDPSVPGPFVTKNASALLSAVNAIFPSGGGDCPELAQTGLISAIGAASGGSKLYFYSDASSKDASLAGNVAAAANRKKITINYILTGSCSPVDPAYIRVAESTGGQVFFIPASQTSLIFNLIEPSLTGDLQTVLVVRDQLSAGGSRAYDLPVDSTSTRLTVSVSLDSLGAVRLFRPSGDVVASGDPDTTITNLLGGRILSVNAPQPGPWHVEIDGSGDLFTSAFVNSPLELYDVSLVELRGQVEHQGLFPLRSQPVVGDPQIGRGVIFGPYADAEIDFHAPDGSLLGPTGLTLGGHPDGSDIEYTGDLTLPAGPFRFYAHGTDDAGFEFQRAFPVRFQSQPLRVTALDEGTVLALGATTVLRFEVENLGAAGTFQVTAADEGRFVSALTPSTLSLASGETAVVQVSLFTPASTSRETDVLTVAVRRSTDPEINNSVVQGVLVGVADADGDGLPDDVDACPSSDLSTTVVIDGCDSGADNALDADGCTLSDRIAELAAGAANHGDFVSGVSALTNQLKNEGALSGQDKGAIVSCAARSAIP